MAQSAPKARKPKAKAASNGPAQVKERAPKTKTASAAAAETKTRQFNEQLRRALDIVSNPTMLIDRDFKITYVNEASKAILT